MPGARPSARLGGIAAALLLAALAVRCLRRDELHCENAVAHLQRCCPGFQPGDVYCVYAESCSVVYPSISEGDASCIVDSSCTTLVENGACARAMEAEPRTAEYESSICR